MVLSARAQPKEGHEPAPWAGRAGPGGARLTGKALMLGKIKGKRIKGQQRMRWLDVSSTRVET